MSMEERIQIRDLDVYAVTDKGDAELKSGSTELSHAALKFLLTMEKFSPRLASSRDVRACQPMTRGRFPLRESTC